MFVIWLFIFPFSENVFPQTFHLKSLNFKCTLFTWIFISDLWLKALLQVVQMNYLFWACTDDMCIFRFPLWENVASQTSHLKGRIFKCTDLICLLSLFPQLNAFSQWGHLWSFTFSCTTLICCAKLHFWWKYLPSHKSQEYGPIFLCTLFTCWTRLGLILKVVSHSMHWRSTWPTSLWTLLVWLSSPYLVIEEWSHLSHLCILLILTCTFLMCCWRLLNVEVEYSQTWHCWSLIFWWICFTCIWRFFFKDDE